MQRFTKALAAIMLMTAMCFVSGCTKPDEPGNGGNGGNNGNNGGGTYNVHEYVDLGLPSGTLWATCNVGATSPEGYGDYFAWGETTPKDTYNWDTYRYCNGYYNKLTKYCSKSGYGDNGFTDTLTVLLPEDDAAAANWGNDWCVPTADQWRELSDNTITVWTTQDGVEGRLLTASNGNSLFLPAAGSHGRYWSSSLYTDYPYNAWYFNFESGYYYVVDNRRDYGLPVRPVRSAPQN